MLAPGSFASDEAAGRLPRSDISGPGQALVSFVVSFGYVRYRSARTLGTGSGDHEPAWPGRAPAAPASGGPDCSLLLRSVESRPVSISFLIGS